MYHWIHGLGCIGYLHICGNIEDRLDLIPETGARILSVDYKTSLAKGREAVGKRLVLAGNADPVGVLQMGTPEDVVAAFAATHRELGDHPYIVMPGCGLPPTIPLENIHAMVQFSHKSNGSKASPIASP